MILYPTETLYALGVNALDAVAVERMFAAKGRDGSKICSWLVRNVEDIERYAEVSDTARKLIEYFLPGPLTIELRANEYGNSLPTINDGRVGFRISPDPVAQGVIKKFMAEHNAPLTCTSANVSGAPTLQTPSEILQQFGPNAHLIDEIIDDGPRKGLASTVIRVVGDQVDFIREGEISERDIQRVLQ